MDGSAEWSLVPQGTDVLGDLADRGPESGVLLHEHQIKWSMLNLRQQNPPSNARRS